MQQTNASTSEGGSQYGGSMGQRSVMSIKNAAAAIKRKASYQNQTIDLRVNIKPQTSR